MFAELERQLEEVRTTMREQKATLLKRVDEVRVELSNALTSNQAAVQDLSARIEAATVGGFKQQSFGVLLAIYGAVVSVFA